VGVGTEQGCLAELVVEWSNLEVYNLCHAADTTEIPSSGGGPHDPRLQPFVLLVGPELVLLSLRTQTTGILLNAELRAQHLKVIAHTEIIKTWVKN